MLFDITSKRIVNTLNNPLKQLGINVFADCFSTKIGLQERYIEVSGGPLEIIGGGRGFFWGGGGGGGVQALQDCFFFFLQIFFINVCNNLGHFK